MGYTIIFETKMVTLSDGNILWFSREGCNNDNAGRKQDEFSAKVQTREEIESYAKSLMKDSKPIKESDGFDLKIGSRYVTWFDYGKHLLRMLKNTKDYSDFVTERYVRGHYSKSVDIIEPFKKTVSSEEFEDLFYKYAYEKDKFSYCRNLEFVYAKTDNEAEVVKEIKAHKWIEFYIGKSR